MGAGVATASMMPTEDTTFLAEEHLGRDLQEYGDEYYGDEEEDYDEDEESNEEVPVAVKVEEKPFMMGGQPTGIDMSKLNQCRPGYGFHIPGVMKCVRDPPSSDDPGRRGDRKGRGNNKGRFGDQSKGKGKGRQGQRPSGKQMQRMQKMRKAM